jgi:hypothetical protein
MKFLELDMGSKWVANNLVRHYIHTGNLAKAREMSDKATDSAGHSQLINGCLNHIPAAELDALSKRVAREDLNNPDAENRYVFAGLFAFCGQRDVAMTLLKSSIAGNYCAYPALQTDSMLANIRSMPEFGGVLAAAKKCQSDFLAERSRTSN